MTLQNQKEIKRKNFKLKKKVKKNNNCCKKRQGIYKQKKIK